MKVLSLTIFVVITTLLLLLSLAKKTKRVLNGDVVYSHEEWNTYYAVVLMKTWACTSDQISHQVGGCQQRPFCSGSLLTVNFVVTACHCVSYQDWFHRNSVNRRYKFPPPIGFFGRLLLAFIKFYLVREHVHKFYSSIAILAGSPEIAEMNQKRHAERVYPYPSFNYNSNFSLLNHDIALVRVCVPFKITQFVKPAPMLPLDKLKPHYDNLIARSAICLMTGFGLTEYVKDSANTKFLTYTWRYLACSAYCNRNVSIAGSQRKNPCLVCSTPIHPRLGAPTFGDSGCPIACDGFYTAIHTAANWDALRNVSGAIGYALYCIKNAITPQRLAYYRTIPGNADLEYLGPLNYDRLRRHTINGDEHLNDYY